MQIDPITRITAIAGCVTGFLSLGVSLAQYLANSPRLKICFYRPHLIGTIPNPSRSFACKTILFLPVSLVNNSPCPVALSSSSFRYKGRIHHVEPIHVGAISFDLPSGNRIEYLESLPAPSLPITIQPGSVSRLALVFPFSDILDRDCAAKPRRISINFFVSGKRISRRVVVRQLSHSTIEQYMHDHKRKIRKLEQ